MNPLNLGEELTVYQVRTLRERCLEALNSAQEAKLLVELGEVKECDSAGLQLLVSLSQSAARRKLALAFTPPSPALLSSARNAGLDLERLLSPAHT